MKNLPTHDDCCGCEACVQACPKQCITMVEDKEGFLYPSVDVTHCVHCQLCERACPALGERKVTPPAEVVVVQNPDTAVRESSSSGGAFPALAEAVVARGGVVFGARFDVEWNVVHAAAETLDGIRAFRQSKYVQSRIGHVYRDVEALLKAGREVLFSGTPCQVAGLKGFLHKDYDRLITVDVVCHGVPSPGVWRTYLAEEVRAQLAAHPGVQREARVTHLSFRDKRNSWYGFGFGLAVSDRHGEERCIDYFEPLDRNAFLRGFIANLYLRPACHHCPCKCYTSGSDLSLADAWGLRDFMPAFDDERGATSVLAFTAKGAELLGRTQLTAHRCDLSVLLPHNPAFEIAARPNPKCDHFFALAKQQGVRVAVARCLPPTRYVDKLMWSYRKRFPKKVKRPKILLVGTGSLLNYGCEAIVQGTHAIVRKNLPGADVYVASDDKAYDRSVLPPDVHLVSYRKRFTPYRLWRGILRRFFHVGKGSAVHMNPAVAKRFDVVLSCGGDNFCEAPNQTLYTILTDLMAIGQTAHAHRRKYVLWGASVGPFKQEANRQRVFRNLALADLVCTREALSYEYVTTDEALRPRTYLVADPAFCMAPDPDVRFEKEEGAIYIGLNLSFLAIGHAVSDDRQPAFIDTLFQHLDDILTMHPAYRFVCIPHVVMKGARAQDDREFLNRYVARTIHKARVTILPPDIGARKTKGYIARMDLLVAARMHCCVGGISTATPTLFLTYSNKGRGMAYYAYGHHRYEVEMQDATGPTFARLIDEMVTDRAAIRAQLQVRQPAFVRDAMNGGLLLRCVLQKQ